MMKQKNNRVSWFILALAVLVGGTIVYGAIPQNTIRENAGITMPTFNATDGYFLNSVNITDNIINADPLGNATFNSVDAEEFYLNGNNKTDLLDFPQRPLYTNYEHTRTIDDLYHTSPMDLENVDDWSNVADAVIANDTVYFTRGNQSIRITTNTTKASGGIVKSPVALDLSGQVHMEVSIYLHDANYDPSSSNIALQSAGGAWANYYQILLPPVDGTAVGQWHKIELEKGEATIGAGAPDWSDIVRVQFNIYHSAANTTVSLDDFRVVTDEYKGKITLRFDDVQLDQYTEAMPIMDTYGYRGLIAANTGSANTVYLDAMYSRGWDVISHAVTHAAFSSFNLAETDYQCRASQQWLFENNYTRGANFFAPPGGNVKVDQLDIIKKYYMAKDRHNGSAGCRTFSILDPYNIDYEITPATGAWTWNTIQGWVNESRDNDIWLMIIMHEVDAPVFTQLVDYINQEGIEVVTFSDVFYDITSLDKQMDLTGSVSAFNTNTTATWEHGLANAPTSISLTPTWNAAAYVSAYNVTHITATFNDPTATKTLYWTATYVP